MNRNSGDGVRSEPSPLGTRTDEHDEEHDVQALPACGRALEDGGPPDRQPTPERW